MQLAPVVLFVYNRPWHTQQVIESLQKNEYAEQTDLIIYSDGPRDDQTWIRVQKVRNYIRNIGGFRSVKIIEHKGNLGLSKSIIEGVTEILSEFGCAIVLEDDVLTSQYFLRFMNDALERYQKYEKVMHVSGYMFPIDSKGLDETFFIRPTSCWGWATWQRAWKYYKKEPEKLIREFSDSMIQEFNIDKASRFFKQIEDNYSGVINTWAIFWYATVFLEGGLSLHPSVSMTQNIGMDNSGMNCRRSSYYDVGVALEPILYFPDELKIDYLATSRLGTLYRNQRGIFNRFKSICLNIKNI